MERPGKAIRELILVMQRIRPLSEWPSATFCPNCREPHFSTVFSKYDDFADFDTFNQFMADMGYSGVNGVDSLVAVVEIRYWILEGG